MLWLTAIAFSYVATPEKYSVSSSSVQERSWSIITVLLLSPKETLQPLLRSISVAATFGFTIFDCARLRLEKMMTREPYGSRSSCRAVRPSGLAETLAAETRPLKGSHHSGWRFATRNVASTLL